MADRLGSGRLFGFTRRHLTPRLEETLTHRNVIISLCVAGVMTFVGFRLHWLPALTKVAVKDFVAGVLAFSALGFGAATAATMLALSASRNSLYLTMIVNGTGAPRARVNAAGQVESRDPAGTPLLSSLEYGSNFRSFYGDLIFVFLWTMSAQLLMGVGGLFYLVLDGDLNMIDCSNCRRSSIGFMVSVATVCYAMLQMSSLIRAIADYARNQEAYDRRDLLGL